MSRHFWLLIHRYAGLFISFFLVIAGLTGSILAFYHELNNWLNPSCQVAIQTKPMLDPLELRDKALMLEPNGRINSLNLQRQPGEVFTAVIEPKINPETNKPYAITPVNLNPYTGESIITVQESIAAPIGYWPLNRKNILPFIYELHYSLLMGETGLWLFGIAATIWTIDCFVGFYLTFPIRKKSLNSVKCSTPINILSKVKSKQPNFWQRWLIAWKIKWPSSKQRLHFDLHRAGGLWLWLMLFIFAWSAVLLNMNATIYQPVMKLFFDMTEYENYPVPNLANPLPDPMIDFKTGYQIGRQLVAEQAQLKGFKIIDEQSFSYHPTTGLYQYSIRTDRDITNKSASSHIYFDGANGKLVKLFLPTGEKSGDTITCWLAALHMANVWGLPYQIFVCVFGLAIILLTITGIYIWYKKRQARILSKRRYKQR